MKDNLLLLHQAAKFNAREFQAGITACHPDVPFKTIRMACGKTLRLERIAGASAIEVKSGVIWLTGTPAAGDVILSAGDKFELRDRWPFVIQALNETELALRRSHLESQTPASRWCVQLLRLLFKASPKT